MCSERRATGEATDTSATQARNNAPMPACFQMQTHTDPPHTHTAQMLVCGRAEWQAVGSKLIFRTQDKTGL